MAYSLIDDDTLHEMESFARAAPAGDLVEVGVYRGGSAEYLGYVAAEQGRRLFLFDTFSGMPIAGPGDYHQVGEFADTSVEDVRALVPNAIFCVGVFPETLTPEVGPIAFAHIDCDQYESTRACCEMLAPRMVRGGVMWFDDATALKSAAQAVEEVFGDRAKPAPRSGKLFVRF